MKTESPNWIAVLEVNVIHPAGKSELSSVKIGQPYSCENHWNCPVDLGKPLGRGSDITGESSLQALSLACDFVYRVFADLKRSGYQWVDPVSDEEIPLIEMLKKP